MQKIPTAPEPPPVGTTNNKDGMIRLNRRTRGGFSLIELAVSILLIIVLLSVLIPALNAARNASYRERCAENLRLLGQAVTTYVDAYDGYLPTVPADASWQYGGVRFSIATDEPFLDANRPLNRWISPRRAIGQAAEIFCCPADRGITGDLPEVGTGHRSACRAFGTSYRANAPLFDGRVLPELPVPRGMHRREITAPPSRLLLFGDAVWYEVLHDTGRNADWHGSPGTGNLVFLDGSVRFQSVRPRGEAGPVLVDPILPGTPPEILRGDPVDDDDDLFDDEE